MSELCLATAGLVLFASGHGPLRRSYTSLRTNAGEIGLFTSGAVRLAIPGVSFEIAGRDAEDASSGDVRAVHDELGLALDRLSLSVLVDGAPGALSLEVPAVHPEWPSQVLSRGWIRSEDRPALEAEVGYGLVRSAAALSVSLKPSSEEATHRKLALVFSLPPSDAIPFVSGTGILADAGAAFGPCLVIEGEQRAIAIGAPVGNVHVRLAPPDASESQKLALSVESPERAEGEPAVLFVAVAKQPSGAMQACAALRQEPARTVEGRVVGGKNAGIDVWGIDGSAHVLAHARTEADGRFRITSPAADLGIYAALSHTRASAVVRRPLGDDSDIELPLLPGGEVHVRVLDADSKIPLTSRLVLHGISPTADPNFGPDYRASGAGPLMDALRGEVTFTIPTGSYRILATHGPEYTIDEKSIDIAPGSMRDVQLLLRHVIDMPRLVGCDYHVHARPSFDSPVIPEDRVLSLVSAGIRFAVPAEHNVVGHYGPALKSVGLERELEHAPGVEITTARPCLGHFGVFPYDEPRVPPYYNTTVSRIFAKARGGDPSRVIQVNHPRLSRAIGYFDLIGLDTRSASADHLRDDFDTLEVYNGYDNENRARVEAVLMDWLRLLERGHRYVATGDSDSHRIQYHWAGYPRTYVELPQTAVRNNENLFSAAELVASLKAGHAFVTNGPFIEADIDGHGIGQSVVVRGEHAQLHVRVRSAPWIDVNELEVYVGSHSLARVPIPSRPTVTGSSLATIEQARHLATRYEENFDIPVAPRSKAFVVVVVRGERKMDDVLPYMSMQPFAFTNPIWLQRD